ncbi:MAG: DUF6502 family protein [Gammaproteobacteria bacterium]|nr:DUF6502 family protein [Gammaproteobacteria bacterium]
MIEGRGDSVPGQWVSRKRFTKFAVALLRPVIRILLRYGMSYPEMNQITRWLYVDIAMREREFFIPRRRRQFKARVACLTGLSRKEVLRLVSAPPPEENRHVRLGNRAARVLAGWLNDPRLQDERGRIRRIPIKPASDAPRSAPSFFALSQGHSGDIPPRAILDELVRSGNVRLVGRNEAEVVEGFYQLTPLDESQLQAASRLLRPCFENIERCLAAAPRSAARTGSARGDTAKHLA